MNNLYMKLKVSEDEMIISKIELFDMNGSMILKTCSVDTFFDTLKLMPTCNIFIHDLNYYGYILVKYIDKYGFKHDELLASDGGFYNSYMYYRNKKYMFRDSKKMVPVDESKVDVLPILARLLEDNNKGYTIGSRCMYEFKRESYDLQDFNVLFPDLTKIECPIEGFTDTDEYIRKSYFGGWCFLKKSVKNRVVGHGFVLDVNSLYPYEMHSSSGNYYPWGKPEYILNKDYSVNELLELMSEKFPRGNKKRYYFIRFKAQFKLKKNYLPTIRIRDNILYNYDEYLATSDVEFKGQYYSEFINVNGLAEVARPTITLAESDFKLFIQHYDIKNFEFLDACSFACDIGLFDRYIDKYYAKKSNTSGIEKIISKLYLNNLGGKFGTNRIKHNKKLLYTDDDLQVIDAIAETNTIYVPVSSAMCSYSRYYTVTSAQANYKSFYYSDTDSLHLSELPKNLNIDDKELGAWKIESEFIRAKFFGQKEYIEQIGTDDYTVKFAGCSKEAKSKLAEDLKAGTVILHDIKPGYEISGNRKAMLVNGVKQKLDVSFTI